MTWFTPTQVGYVTDKRKIHVVGLAYDYDGILLALSVIGPNTLTEAIHYDLQGQDATLTVAPTIGGYRAYNRYTYSRKNHFKVWKKPIPDTSDHNLILVNELIHKPDRDYKWTFVPWLNEEDFKMRLFYRVKQIVSIPLKLEWRHWMYEYGMKQLDNNRGLCLKATTPVEDDIRWTSAGFSIGYIYNSQELWEKVVSDGLKQKQIFI